MNKMKIKIITAVISIMLISTLVGAPFVEKDYILLDILYEDGKFTLLDKNLERGNHPTINHDLDKEYRINLISDKKDLLYTKSFDPRSLYSDGPTGPIGKELRGGIIKLDKVEFFLIVPSNNEGEKVEILKDDEIVFEEEVYDVGAKPCRVR